MRRHCHFPHSRHGISVRLLPRFDARRQVTEGLRLEGRGSPEVANGVPLLSMVTVSDVPFWAIDFSK
jgi:hypothetical protein